MPRLPTEQKLAAAAVKSTSGHLETEEVKQNDTITYIPGKDNSEDWTIREAFLNALTTKKTKEEIVKDLVITEVVIKFFKS